MDDVLDSGGVLYLSGAKPDTVANSNGNGHGNGHGYPNRHGHSHSDGDALLQVVWSARSLLSGGNTGVRRPMSTRINVHSTGRLGLIR